MQNEKQWHPNFIKYMQEIIHHPNYRGLPIRIKKDGSYAWIEATNSLIGKERKRWCINKAQEIGLIKNYEEYPGIYADVMFRIHPTKRKVCQICGREMSLFYYYPNNKFLNSLNKKFNSAFTDCDNVWDIWDRLIICGFKKEDIAEFFIEKGGLNLDKATAQKEEIINKLEKICHEGKKKCLGPGAMSNFPDRYDGFHTYNRCCRAVHDKGRSKENLKSYSKDRRAYEYWNDGNIHAADQFMGSHFFYNMSADHIGPISLGFVHDPLYLQPMLNRDNSSKRDRLQKVDIEKMIQIEKRTQTRAISWYAIEIWKFIKENYLFVKDDFLVLYRNALKQNMANFMFVLKTILESCPNNGELFLFKSFLEPKCEYFKYSYILNEKGEIIDKKPRHNTERNKDEMIRYKQIAIDAVYDYNKKNNRNNKNDLNIDEKNILESICLNIELKYDISKNNIYKKLIVDLMKKIQNRIIRSILSYNIN